MSVPGGFGNSKEFIDYSILTAEDVTTVCSSLVVAAGGIAYSALYKKGSDMTITFTSPVLTGYIGAKYIQITGATDPLNNGQFEIILVDTDHIHYYNPFITDNSKDESGPGTIAVNIPDGCNRNNSIAGTPIYNADRDICAMQYGSDQDFYYKVNSDKDTLIQIVNNHASTDGLTYTIKWSLDGITWCDFPTAVTGTVDHGETDGLVLTYHPSGMKLKIAVDSNSATYYIIAK